ncbi:Equilibrative nucleoside transporter 3 [Halotydeus destructor]|nr:Equilibrative nucleoside transporter 3 [Halotydeus destructor]
MLMLGIGAVLPWNMFINANSYFVDYKLPQSNDTTVNHYRSNFLSFVGVSAIGPNFLLQLWNLFHHGGSGSFKMRIVATSVIEIMLMCVTIILAVLDSTGWPAYFFFVTMATVIVLNMAGGVFQNSAIGVAAKLPMSYTNAIVTGMSLGSTFAALASIISIAISSGPQTAAIVFFSIVLVYLVILMGLYWSLHRNSFYRFHDSKLDDATVICPRCEDPVIHSSLSEQIHVYMAVFVKCWPQCLNTFLVFFVSFSIFPAVQADIVSVDGLFSRLYFAPITTFLTFNFFAVMGNLFVCDMFKKPGPKYLWIPITLRFLFMPFFLFCNYQPLNGRSVPVWITSDWVFWFGNMLFGFTSGYFSSLSMIYAPKSVSAAQAPVAAMMVGFALIAGCFAGAMITFTWPLLVR